MSNLPQRILLVKTSSMGDLVHTLSAVQEAARLAGPFELDWVCEAPFCDVAALAPGMKRLLPVSIRRWRKSVFSASTRNEISAFKNLLRSVEYDVVIDAQGLLKTAWITRLARCRRANRWGYDWASAREPLASWAVKHTINAPASGHAIQRLRVLFGAALGYVPQGAIATVTDANIVAASLQGVDGPAATHREILLLHGTSRREKSWPVESWVALGRGLASQGYQLLLPWGSEQEREQADRIARGIGGSNARVLEKLGIAALSQKLMHAVGAIGVDSGLMHLSVALGRPTVAVMTAAHLQKFAARRFAPTWAAHARVVSSQDNAEHTISVDTVLAAWGSLS